MGERRNALGYWWESQMERDQGVGGWTILKWILERYRVGWYGFN
jgi:hypothetical protein